MSLGDFLRKQLIDVIQWTEEGDGVLATRYPMRDMEIQYGARLTVRESQMAVFVNEGKVADAFGPGLYTLETKTLPLLTNLQHWYTGFESPFKSDVYFFSTRIQTDQRWGTQQPITVRDKDFGMVRMRGFGLYSYHLANPVLFHQKVSGTRDTYTVTDLEGHLRNTMVARITDTFAKSKIPFLDMAANLSELGAQIGAQMRPTFEELGLALDSFAVESLSLPEELQRKLDERIGMNMAGNLKDFTQYQAAQAIPTAAANPGGSAGLGVGLGAGMAMGKAMTDALNQVATGGDAAQKTSPATPTALPDQGAAAASASATKFCVACGKSIPRSAKFCPECGGAQG
jgi:membrane protease subunit (stomatin/prohibitin family)